MTNWSSQERTVIQTLLELNYSVRAIARFIKRSPSTVSIEIHQVTPYKAEIAHALTLKRTSSTWSSWHANTSYRCLFESPHLQPSRQEKRRKSLKPYILDVWKTFKFYGYRRIAAYSRQTDGPKVSEYMTLKLMRELGIKSRMQKRYRKPKTLVTAGQKPNLLTPE